MRRYTVVLLPDVEEGGYTVLVPLLPGCVTEGDTLDEALANGREAIELYVSTLEAKGDVVPEEDAPAWVGTVDIRSPIELAAS